MSTAKYPPALRILHWVMALMILTNLIMGFYMADIPRDAPDKLTLYPWHKSFGMILMLLVLIRLPVRWRGPLPDDAPGLQVWERKLSHLVHVLLYLAILTMTCSGYLMASFAPQGQGIDMFGVFTIPDITSKSKSLSHWFHEVHENAAVVFCILIGLHVIAAIKHRLFDPPESNVLPRMM